MTLKSLSFVMTLLFITMSCLTLAQQLTDAEQAIIDAKRDASQPNQFVWSMIAGCIFSYVSLPFAYFLKPSIPVDKIMGKSPEYIEQYIITYRKHVRGMRVGGATLGCLINFGIVAYTISTSPFFQ